MASKVRKAVKKTARRLVTRKLRAGRKGRRIRVLASPKEKAEQNISKAPFTPSTAVVHQATITKTSPELAYQIGLYAPGRIPTPFVMDGQAVAVRTAVGNGHASFTKTIGANNQQLIVFMFPVVASLISPQRSGLMFKDTEDTNAYAVTDLTSDTSVALSDLYGLSTTFSDRIVHYATQYDFVVDAPDANRSGEVFHGSIPLDSFNGTVNLTALMDMATKITSAKETNRYSATVRVVNRPNILQPGVFSVNNLGSECVGYLIFRNYSRNITTGALASYNIEVKVSTNYVYYPDGASPLLTSLVQPTFTSDKIATPAEVKTSHQVSHMNSTSDAAEPETLQDIMKVAAGWLKEIPGLSTVARTINRASTVLKAATSFVMTEMEVALPRVRDEINFVQWIQGRISSVFNSTYSTGVEDRLDQLDIVLRDLLDELILQDGNAIEWNQFLDSIPRRFDIHRKGRAVLYRLNDAWITKAELYKHWLSGMSDCDSDSEDQNPTGKPEPLAQEAKTYQGKVQSGDTPQQSDSIDWVQFPTGREPTPSESAKDFGTNRSVNSKRRSKI